MIKRKTTLILGAGASEPFGFPTGYELLRRVINWGNDDFGNKITTAFSGFEKPDIDKFKEALRRSGKISVDAFLERRPEFIPVGKMAMAWELIKCEHEPYLFKRDGKSWYEYLFNQLDAPFEDFGQNQLRILTFNYDRSLEHFLFTALKNSSGKSEDECTARLATIPIIHLHGNLGSLPHTGAALVRPYNSNISPEILKIATKSIKIIHEGIENEPQFQQAQIMLTTSDVICFLGFGYHPLNMERLGMENLRVGPLGSKNIIGSSFDLTGAEAQQISNRHGFQLRSQQYNYQNLDVLQFLRELGVLHNN